MATDISNTTIDSSESYIYNITINLPINSMNKPSLHQQIISEKLCKKYEEQMNFFCSKPINEIIYNEHRLLSVIKAKAAVYYSDDTQYMRRMYHYYTASGKKEIYNRIQLLADFYSSIRSIQSQYPLMILTNTKKIFLTRLRRLCKMKASDGSSDQSQISNQEKQEFSSEGFLKSTKSIQSSVQLQSIFESVKDRDSFDEQVHNIYMMEDSNLQVETGIQINIQQDVGHLICDFEDFDAKKILKDYEKLMKMGYEIQNKVPNQSYMNNPLRTNLGNDNYQIKKNSRYSDLLKNFRNPINNGSASPKLIPTQTDSLKKKSYMANLLANERDLQPTKELAGVHKDKNNSDNLQILIGQRFRNTDNSNATREQNQSRKQKIRDKAAQLLSRVTNSNYLNQRSSSNDFGL